MGNCEFVVIQMALVVILAAFVVLYNSKIAFHSGMTGMTKTRINTHGN